MKKVEDREKLMMNLLGDFKKLSTNPRAATFKPSAKFKAKALAKTKEAAKARIAQFAGQVLKPPVHPILSFTSF